MPIRAEKPPVCARAQQGVAPGNVGFVCIEGGPRPASAVRVAAAAAAEAVVVVAISAMRGGCHEGGVRMMQ